MIARLSPASKVKDDPLMMAAELAWGAYAADARP